MNDVCFLCSRISRWLLVSWNEVLVADVRLLNVIAKVMEVNIVKRVSVERWVRGSVSLVIYFRKYMVVLLIMIRIVGVIHFMSCYFHHLVNIQIRIHDYLSSVIYITKW
jgi:hypothetical protein